MKANELDFNKLNKFSASEWPKGVLDKMDASVIQALSDVRGTLPVLHKAIPSPVYGAHVRENGTSRHSTDYGKRLSDATDFFVSWDHAWDWFIALQRHPDIGGVGIYTDMMLYGTEGDMCMFHIDMRPTRLVWVGWRKHRGATMRYVYQHNQPIEFHKVLYQRGKHPNL